MMNCRNLCCLKRLISKFKEDVLSMDGLSESLSPSQMEGDRSTVSSGVPVPPTPEPFQHRSPLSPSQMQNVSSHLSGDGSTSPMPTLCQHINLDSSPILMGDSLQDIGTRARNLRSKRILAIWRNRSKDYGHPTVAHPEKRRRKNKANFGATGFAKSDCGKPIQSFTRTKRKRERVVEDSYGDPHIYRIPQRHAI